VDYEEDEKILILCKGTLLLSLLGDALMKYSLLSTFPNETNCDN